jgi:hypothetical protein
MWDSGDQKSLLAGWWKAIKTSHISLWHDILAREWRIGPLIFLWFVGMLAPFTLLGLASDPGVLFTPPLPCLPNGTFTFNEDSFNIWMSSGFFDVSLEVGTYSFTQAKIIDVCWDIVIRAL